MISSRLRVYASFVRFSHSVFALPFAFAGAFLAFKATGGITRAAALWRTGWIIVAMVSARSAAMGFNRLADARFDALNPRTANRELPSGVMSRAEALVFVVAASAVFLFATWELPRICFVLAPVALVIVFWYSLAKRFTAWTQLFLGLAMAVAPVGGWLAAGGQADRVEPWLLALAIAMWVGGFDILYACQDLDFDRAHGLRSIPERFGISTSLRLSRLMHAVAVLCLAAVSFVPSRPQLAPVYLFGVAAVAALLVYEQSLVTADDLSRVKRAFDLNGYVGILYVLVVIVSLYGP